MCGLAGMAGVNSRAKFRLAYFLGKGIDKRGGDSAGYAKITDKGIYSDTRIGKWQSSSGLFLERASNSDITMMHARFATCGFGTLDEAHPFKIKRKGMPVIIGMHNGIIWDAEYSAAKNDREFTVDSKELFELIADKKWKQIEDLNGYGVVTWIDVDEPDHVKLCKLTDCGEIEACELVSGGIVWGSTPQILYGALRACGLLVKKKFKLSNVGYTYRIYPHGIYATKVKGPLVSRFRLDKPKKRGYFEEQVTYVE